MFHEKMTPSERMESLHETGFADRPGAFVLATGFIPKMTGNLTIGECYEYPIRYAKAFHSVQQMLGFDSGPLFGHPAFAVKEFGGRLSYPRSNSRALFPVITRRPVNKPEDVDKLEVPDPHKAGDIPKEIAGAKFVMDSYPKGYRNPILVTGDTFTWAGNIVGLDTLLIWLQNDPDLAMKLLDKVSEFQVELVKYALTHVGDIYFFDGGPSDSNDLITSKQFEKFALPPMMSYRRKAMKAGATKFISHPCGNQTKNIEYWAQMPGTFATSFDFRTPLETGVSRFSKDAMIIGNIECIQFTLGDVDWIYNKAMTKLKMAANRCPKGYMVAPGCELPALSSPVNVHAMVRAARDFAEGPEWKRH
jgi:uroporphyrinogen decarboxylase